MNRHDVDQFTHINKQSSRLFLKIIHTLLNVRDQYDVVVKDGPTSVNMQQHVDSLNMILGRVYNHWREHRMMVAIVRARFLETIPNLTWDELVAERKIIQDDFVAHDQIFPKNVDYEGFLNYLFSSAQWGITNPRLKLREFPDVSMHIPEREEAKTEEIPEVAMYVPSEIPNPHFEESEKESEEESEKESEKEKETKTKKSILPQRQKETIVEESSSEEELSKEEKVRYYVPPKKKPGESIRLITFNVNSFQTHKKYISDNRFSINWNGIEKLLQTYRPDIVCTQEDLSNPSIMGSRFNRVYCSTNESGTILTNVIYSIQELTNVKNLNIKGEAKMQCPTDRCSISATWQDSLVVANVHLCGGKNDDKQWEKIKSVREKQLKQIVEHVHPDLIVGDFNSDLDWKPIGSHPIYDTLTLKKKQDFVTYMKNGHSYLAKQGYQPVKISGSKKTSVYGGQPDHIYFKRDRIMIKNSEVIDFLKYSDHNAILIDFVIQPTVSSSPPSSLKPWMDKIQEGVGGVMDFSDFCQLRKCLSKGDKQCCDAYKEYLANEFAIDVKTNVFDTILKHLQDIDFYPPDFVERNLDNILAVKQKIEFNRKKCEGCFKQVQALRAKDAEQGGPYNTSLAFEYPKDV